MFSKNKLAQMFDTIRPLRFMERKFLGRFSGKNKEVLDFGAGRMPNKRWFLKRGMHYHSADVGNEIKHDYPVPADGVIDTECKLFDLILISDVIQHVENCDETLAHLATLLKDEGVIVVTTAFIFPECDYEDYRRWSYTGVDLLAKDASMEVLAKDRRGGFVLCLLVFVMSELQNRIIGERRGWRNSATKVRSVCVLATELVFLPFLWVALCIDKLFPSKVSYLGVMCALKRVR